MHQRITVRQRPEKARHRGRRLGAVASASGLLATLALAPATTASASVHARAQGSGGSTFTWALDDPQSSLDFATDPEIQGTGIVMSLVTQPLEALSSTNQYTPVLATSVGLPNPSTLVYHIRSGVKFSNGAPLTATDVAWSIMHAVEPSLASATQMPSIASATPTAPLTVTVKLKTPNPVARADIAMTVLVQNAAFGKAHGSALGTASAVPIGTGPYKVSSDTASNITLVRSSGYWGKYPPFSSVVFPVITDDNSRELAIRSGSINGSELVDLKDIEQWASIPGVSVYKSPSNSLDLVGFDVAKPPFNDVHVRRAIAYAIQKQALAHAALDNNVSPVSGGLVPDYEVSDVAGSVAAADKFISTLPSYNYSPSAAEAQMKQSAYPHGFTTTVQYIDTVPWELTFVLALQQELKPLGITVTPKPVSFNAWFGDFFTHKLVGLNLLTLANALVNDPSGILTYFVGAQGSYNFSQFQNAAVDNASNVVNSDVSSAQRWAATKVILSQVADQVPYIPLWTEPSPLVLKGYKFTGSSGLSLFQMTTGQWIYDLKPAS
jgi:peptide/nickel transport system substrate-binding protein